MRRPGRRPNRDASTPPPRSRLARGAQRGAGLPLGLRAGTGHWPAAGSAASPSARPGLAGGSPVPSAATASGSSSSGRSGATTGRETAGWRALRSGSACPASRRGTCTCTTAPGRRFRTRWPPCRSTARSSRPSPGGGATARARWPAAGRWRCGSASTPPRWPRAGFSPSACASTSRATSATRYPGSEDESADPALAAICRARLEHRYAGMPERAEAARRLEEELEMIAKLRLSGFFLLHYDILELARRGRRRGPRARLGADAAAAGARARARASARSSAT